MRINKEIDVLFVITMLSFIISVVSLILNLKSSSKLYDFMKHLKYLEK